MPAVLDLGFSFPRLLATLFGFQFCRSSQASLVFSAVSPGDSVALHFNFLQFCLLPKGSARVLAGPIAALGCVLLVRQGATDQSWWLGFYRFCFPIACGLLQVKPGFILESPDQKTRGFMM
jgi:hypothetical protein